MKHTDLKYLTDLNKGMRKLPQLTHFMQLVSFYTLWKHQKTRTDPLTCLPSHCFWIVLIVLKFQVYFKGLSAWTHFMPQISKHGLVISSSEDVPWNKWHGKMYYVFDIFSKPILYSKKGCLKSYYVILLI